MINIVCFSMNAGQRGRERTRQLMERLAERSDVGRVVWVESPVSAWKVVWAMLCGHGDARQGSVLRRAWIGFLEPSPDQSKLFVYTPVTFIPVAFRFRIFYQAGLFFVCRRLCRLLDRVGFSDIILYLSHPFDEPLLRWFRPRQIACFDWVEAWSKYFKGSGPEARQEVLDLEHRTVRGADMVLTASWRLLEIARKLNPTVYQVFDGISPEAFEEAIPVEKTALKHPVAGYIGAISDRFDVELVDTLARRMPDWTFVFVGKVEENRVDISLLQERPNIVFVQYEKPEVVPSYVASFDACFLPYIPEPLSPPPTKLFKYLASGKPVVASALPEFDFLAEGIVFAKDAGEFEKALREALTQDTPQKAGGRRELARRHSWAARADELVKLWASGCRRRVLIIPHHPLFEDLRIRLVEMARHLAKEDDVFVCDWHAARDPADIMSRVGSCLMDLFRAPRARKEGDLHFVETPFLHQPLAWAPRFNAFWLERLSRRLGINTVVNGSYYLFEKSAAGGYRYVVDLADLPSRQEDRFDRFLERQVAAEISKADAVSVSSRGLVDHAASHYGCQPVFIPNGTAFDRFESLSLEAVAEVRSKYRLENKWVISHIGYMGSWVDVDFLINVFRKVKRVIPEAALLWIGSAPDFEALKKRYDERDIIFAGPVLARDIEVYFCASDIGVLPNKKSPFQDAAFHIKIIEYGAARKCVLSSNLTEVERLGLPHVTAEPLEQEAWVRRLMDMRQARWSDAWDAALSPYDWAVVLRDFKKLL